MREWLQELFHFHRWEIIKASNLTVDDVMVGVRYVQCCQRCGRLKKIDFC